MVRYQLYGAGRTWTEEYGSADNEDDFRALYAYSPYHHVKQGVAYPSVLLASADSDDRVEPMHARKMGAALQAASSGGGAGPSSDRKELGTQRGRSAERVWVAQYADRYAFALAEIKKQGSSMGF